MKVKTNPFTTWDYVVFFGTLVIAMGIGILFAFKGRKNKTQGEYLVANRSMPVIPVSISIIVSYMSAISILGTPAEIYSQGTAYSQLILGIAVACVLSSLLFVPLIYPLQLTSIFEYLERRFNSRPVRLVGTWIMILTQVIYMATASFAPATALETVTGFPVWVTLIIIGAASTFYTCVGGMKAVIWTDVFQAGIMFAGMFAVIIQGVLKVGGLTRVWEIGDEWGRINFFNMDPDPRVRHSFWSVVIGSAMSWVGTFGLSQPSAQRYCSLRSFRKAQGSQLLIMLGSNLIVACCCFSGLVIFAYYVTQDCDPLGQKLVDNPNQMVPFFVMETLAYPCIPGIFMSALFSGALSTISSSLNSLAAVTWEDVIKPHINIKMSEARKLSIIQSLVVIYGCIALGTSFIVQNLEGTVIQIAVSLLGASGGPLTGMFILGAFFPWANAKGAIAGALISLGLSSWIAIGAYVQGIPMDHFDFPNGTCSQYLYNETSSIMTTTTTPSPFVSTTVIDTSGNDHKTGIEQLYTLSYMWYATLGIVTNVIVGLIISFITGANSMNDVPTKYQIPIASWLLCCLPVTWQKTLNCNRTFDEVQDTLYEQNETKYLDDMNQTIEIPHPEKQEKDSVEYDNLAFTPDTLKTPQKPDTTQEASQNGNIKAPTDMQETNEETLTNGHTVGFRNVGGDENHPWSRL